MVAWKGSCGGNVVSVGSSEVEGDGFSIAVFVGASVGAAVGEGDGEAGGCQ